jgi:acetyltransferase-like isoleucine patch superfamily enzyme
MTVGSDFRVSSGSRFNPIGGDVKSKFYCTQGAALSIGNNVGISNSAIFVATSVTIEDNVMIGGGCKIWDTDFHSINSDERIYQGDRNAISKPIIIQENAFIGAAVVILKGVNIGKNSVVGAASVVTKSIPDNEIWAGNPAKKIRSI